MKTTLELLTAYRDLSQENTKLIMRLSELIKLAAQTNLVYVDSQIVLDILQEHNAAIREINKRIIGNA